MNDIPGQLDLFTGESLPEPPRKGGVSPCQYDSPLVDLGRRLPQGLFLGTSSWSFPGWKGLLYRDDCSETRLAQRGLSSYAGHPLLRAVGLDRTYYAPVGEEQYREYAQAVPDGFRFLVKAPELLTVGRFPQHPRYGDQGGQSNPTFLDAAWAREQLIEPALAGLGDKLGVLLFQFPPQSVTELGGGASFALRLHQFFEQLPEGPGYAVELRNPQLLCNPYLSALNRLHISHCLNVHPSMPALETQDARTDFPQPWKVVRWMLGTGDYQEALDRYRPFDKLVDEDPTTRTTLARLCRGWLARGQKVLVIVNNKAEGCAPLSLRKLAEALLDEVPF